MSDYINFHIPDRSPLQRRFWVWNWFALVDPNYSPHYDDVGCGYDYGDECDAIRLHHAMVD